MQSKKSIIELESISKQIEGTNQLIEEVDKQLKKVNNLIRRNRFIAVLCFLASLLNAINGIVKTQNNDPTSLYSIAVGVFCAVWVIISLTSISTMKRFIPSLRKSHDRCIGVLHHYAILEDNIITLNKYLKELDLECKLLNEPNSPETRLQATP